MNALKDYRAKHGLSMGQAAKRVGVSRITWLRWEAGSRAINVSRLHPLSKATGIPPSQLRPDLAKVLR